MSKPTFHSRIMNISFMEDAYPIEIAYGHKQARHAAAEIAAEADARIRELEEDNKILKEELLDEVFHFNFEQYAISTDKMDEHAKKLGVNIRKAMEKACGYESLVAKIKELEQQLAESATAHQKDLAYAKNQHDMFIKKLAEVTEWRDISDEPTAGQLVIAKYEGVYGPTIVKFWRDTSKGHFGHQPATHWLPLPASNEVKS